jgi:antitoxin component of MazEF toxin-antitoxin module
MATTAKTTGDDRGRATESGGIKWSAPVLIRRAGAELVVSLPAKVIEKLRVGDGDVLNFTELPDGGVEVWMVKKSSYASLDAMAKPAASKPAAPKRGGKK